MSNSDFPVDLVYLWVDGNDPDWQKEKKYWEAKLQRQGTSETNNSRFSDQQELRYSLRSCFKFAPWINRIFIVTNGQIPSWLDLSKSSKIKIITHDQIMPADALPVFNSEAIETCISNIEDLSEHFILANDDVFFNKEISKDYYFDKTGNPIYRLVKNQWSEDILKSNLYCRNVVYSSNLVKDQTGKDYRRYESSHSFMPCRKSIFSECKEIFCKQFDQTTHAKFRKPDSVQKTLIAFYALAKNSATLRTVKNVGRHAREDLFLNFSSVEKAFDELQKTNPFTFCLNDNERVSLSERKKIRGILNRIFPDRCSFEKDASIANYQIQPAFSGKATNAIVLAIDDAYAKYCASTIQSIIENSEPDSFYDLIIFETNVSDRNKKLLKKGMPERFSLRFFDVCPVMYDLLEAVRLNVRSYWSIAVYFRLMIPILMGNYDRVLYLDSDICINGSFQELFTMDLGEKQIAAVLDTVSRTLQYYPSRDRQMREDLELEHPENYFNSGMIVFNTRLIDIEKYLGSLSSAMKIDNLLFPDQDILNVIFQNKVFLCSCKFNAQMGAPKWDKSYLDKISSGDYRKDYLEARENPIVVHYTGSMKPWHAPHEEFSEIFWGYERKTLFYEECLFSSRNRNYVTPTQLKNVNSRYRIYLRYWFYKLCRNCSFGKYRTKFEKKYSKYRVRILDVRKFANYK